LIGIFRTKFKFKLSKLQSRERKESSKFRFKETDEMMRSRENVGEERT